MGFHHLGWWSVGVNMELFGFHFSFIYIYIYIWVMLVNAFREIVNKVWLTSSTFLTEISFYFNEKLSHHPLTK